MARIDPLPIKQWPASMRGALAAMTPEVQTHAQPQTTDRPKSLNTLGAFAHHPTLAKAFFTFNGHLLMGTTLSERQRELLVLRVAAVRNCAYEWAQHVFVARDVGLDDEAISRIAFGPDHPMWDPLDAALLRAVDELIADGAISDPTWEVLAAELTVQQLLDVIYTVGAYTVLAMMMRSFQLSIDADVFELEERRRQRS